MAPYAGGQDRQSPQDTRSGSLGLPPLHLPGRYSCPVGASASLSNVPLAPGTYLLGVQPLPDAPTPEPLNDAFEVEMQCRDGDTTAAPLDPTDGGVTVDPVTGQLTVSPGERATPGSYSLNLTAIDSIGTPTMLLNRPLYIRHRPKLSLTAGCGARMNAALATMIDRVNRANGPARRHNFNGSTPVVFPPFLGSDVNFRGGTCGGDIAAAFDNLRADQHGEPDVAFRVRITQLGNTAAKVTLGPDTFVNSETGKISSTLAPMLGPGNYMVELLASSGTSPPLSLHNWTMDIRTPDTVNVANGPHGRGCGDHGLPVDTHPQNDAYTCMCNSKYEGDNCDDKLSKSASKTPLIAACAVSGVLAIGVVLLTQALCKRRKSASAPMYSPLTTNGGYARDGDSNDGDLRPANASYEAEFDSSA